MGEVELPFGETDASRDELLEVIDIDTAVSELEAVGVARSAAVVESFVGELPELLHWLDDAGREYPWRTTTDPWRIYATEILLQRTRSDAVAGLYEEFFESFPAPDSVLGADEADIHSLVSPLGFGNHRVRTLTEAAELCVHDFAGRVPQDLAALQRPWRVGPYTARACMIFAFGEPMALVDTNTARIIRRIFEYPLPEQPHKSERVYRFLDALAPADPGLARAFNFALLDLGALICTSTSPDCPSCPESPACRYAPNEFP